MTAPQEQPDGHTEGLIELLEAAEVGSRELDCLVLEAVTPIEPDGSRWRSLQWAANWFFALFPKDVEPEPHKWLIIAQEQRVTTSLDAALSLAERVLPGHDWSVGHLPSSDDADFEEHHHFGCLFYARPHVASRKDGMAHGATPALAVVTALLRAKEARS